MQIAVYALSSCHYRLEHKAAYFFSNQTGGTLRTISNKRLGDLHRDIHPSLSGAINSDLASEEASTRESHV